MHDTVIRGGTIVDGNGGTPYTGDVAIDEGRISEVGGAVGPAKRISMPTDCWWRPVGSMSIRIMTAKRPGIPFWRLRHAAWSHHHIVRNCGVGFAPVKQEHRRELIDLMEAIEEIPAPLSRKA